MTANVKALVAINFALIAALLAVLFVAFPSQADAAKSKVQYGNIEFRSTIPCDKQGYFVKDSKKASDFAVVSSREGWLGEQVRMVTGVTANKTTVTLPGSFTPKTLVTSVDVDTKTLAAYTIYACTASVVISVR